MLPLFSYSQFIREEPHRAPERLQLLPRQVVASMDHSGTPGGPAELADELAALHLKMQRRDEELVSLRSENLRLRHAQVMLEAELRLTEQQAKADLDVAQCSLRASDINSRAVSRELRNEENVRQALVADHRRRHASTLAEAAAQRAAVTAEIGSFELAALAANTERALLTDALGATERSLADASARANRALRIAELATHAGIAAPSRSGGDAAADAASVPRIVSPSRNDGLTLAEVATGPSGPDVLVIS